MAVDDDIAGDLADSSNVIWTYEKVGSRVMFAKAFYAESVNDLNCVVQKSPFSPWRTRAAGETAETRQNTCSLRDATVARDNTSCILHPQRRHLPVWSLPTPPCRWRRIHKFLRLSTSSPGKPCARSPCCSSRPSHRECRRIEGGVAMPRPSPSPPIFLARHCTGHQTALHGQPAGEVEAKRNVF